MLSKFPRRSIFAIAAAVGKSLQTGHSLTVFGNRATIGRRQHQTNFHTALSASSNLRLSEPEESEENLDESLTRWEEMYQQGEQARKEQILGMTSSGDSSRTSNGGSRCGGGCSISSSNGGSSVVVASQQQSTAAEVVTPAQLQRVDDAASPAIG